MTVQPPRRTPLRLAFLGTYPPRRCGIATFTRDLGAAVIQARAGASIRVLPTTDVAGPYAYGDSVEFDIRQAVKEDYIRAADYINYSDVQLVCIQHEFGIYGGADGAHLLAFLAQVQTPVVATLHTVLRAPSGPQRAILRAMDDRCDRLVVMSDHASRLLAESYGVLPHKIDVIPHGIPELRPGDQDQFKARFGVAGRRMMLTFGLLSRNKGIETAIRALPRLIQRFPDLVYFVVGATHPTVKREQGEEYRLSLEQEAKNLGLTDHVVFRDQWLSAGDLADILRATDVYVTPYRNQEQSTSGTLSYAMGAGAAIVSTPYWHAQELLAGGRGGLFDFGDSEALADRVEALLGNADALATARKAAWRYTRPMTWPRVGESYAALADRILAESTPAPRPRSRAERLPLPPLRLDHVLRMTDDTGMIQHATYSVPARHTGYCVDDNARALIVALLAHRHDPSPHTASLITGYLGYLHHSQTDGGHFRNFMDYARKLEPHSGSDDCAGRALWALGICTHSAPDRGARLLAREMFERAMPLPSAFGLRGQAFALLGLDALLQGEPRHSAARSLVDELAMDIVDRYRAEADEDWHWFEPDLTYDNAVVPCSLFTAYRITGEAEYDRVGRESLDFLEKVCFSGDCLMLVGNDAWHRRGGRRSTADEQPIDAAAFVMAFHAAYRATGNEGYLHRMRASFEWFLGRNRLRLPLYDFATAGCHDALGRTDLNLNQGAESTLSFLLALLAMIEVSGGPIPAPPDGARPANRSARHRLEPVGHEGVDPTLVPSAAT